MNAEHRTLSSEAVRFRSLLIDALWDDRRFGYVDSDCFIGSCVTCGAAIVVRFAGYAPRATLDCHGGCLEAEIAEALGLEVTP
jgi:hypothetical protein